MTINQLLKELEKVKYPSTGKPAVILDYFPKSDKEIRLEAQKKDISLEDMIVTGQWSASLRNYKNWRGSEGSYKSDNPKEALEKLYEYCKTKNYLQ